MEVSNLTLFAAAAGAMIMSAAVQPAAAMPMTALDAPHPLEVIQVHGHHWHHGGHRRWHGSDDYYDNTDDSGVLFKSFVTGTLFDGGRSRAYSNHASACAARYRSYDPADNSYQPNNGPRQACR